MSVNFYVRAAKGAEQTSVIVQVRKGDLNCRIATVKIPVSMWDDKNKCLKPSVNGDVYKTVFPMLKELEMRLNQYLISGEQPTPERCKDIVDGVLHPGAKESIPTDKPSSGNIVIDYCQFMIDKMLDGTITVSDSTRKQWQNFYGLLCRYVDYHKKESHKDLTFESINKTLVLDFVRYMAQIERYSAKTQDKYLRSYHALIRRAYDDNIHSNNVSFEGCFPSLVQAKDEPLIMCQRVALTEPEVTALVNMELSGMEQKVRDVFCLGIATAQRWSDYGKLKKSDFVQVGKGYVVSLIQEKTNNRVKIPIGYQWVKDILSRYDELPELCEQVVSRYIKTILERLSETVTSLKETYPTMLRLYERKAMENAANDDVKLYDIDENGNALKPKWQLVSTHSARRSALTILYSKGKLTMEQLRQISGHRSEDELRHYLLLDDEQMQEQAESIVSILTE